MYCVLSFPPSFHLHSLSHPPFLPPPPPFLPPPPPRSLTKVDLERRGSLKRAHRRSSSFTDQPHPMLENGPEVGVASLRRQYINRSSPEVDLAGRKTEVLCTVQCNTIYPHSPHIAHAHVHVVRVHVHVYIHVHVHVHVHACSMCTCVLQFVVWREVQCTRTMYIHLYVLYMYVHMYMYTMYILPRPWRIMLEPSCIMLCQQFLDMQLLCFLYKPYYAHIMLSYVL